MIKEDDLIDRRGLFHEYLLSTKELLMKMELLFNSLIQHPKEISEEEHEEISIFLEDFRSIISDSSKLFDDMV